MIHRLVALLSTLLLAWGVAGCGTLPRAQLSLNRRLEQLGDNRDPALAGRWLALISGRDGREQVNLIDLERQLPLPLPNLNRPDARPLSVSVDGRGERLALVRHRQDRTEVMLYRRSLASLQAIHLGDGAVPSLVRLSADGRTLAVQVSRNGLWQVELIALP